MADVTIQGHKVKAHQIIISTDRDAKNEGLWQGSSITFRNRIYVQNVGFVEHQATTLTLDEITEEQALALEALLTGIYTSQVHVEKLGADNGQI